MFAKIYTFAAVTFVFVVGFGSLVLPYIIADKHTPGSTKYGFPQPYLNDYFQYVVLIKNGQSGSLLYHNQYSELDYPAGFQPFWNIVGMTSAAVHVDPFDAYIATKYTVSIIFYSGVLLIIWHLLSSVVLRGVASIFFITATAFYSCDKTFNICTDPEMWSSSFNVFKKLTMLPPHHMLAALLLGVILVIQAKKPTDKFFWKITFLLSLILGFVHPYIAATLLIVAVLQTFFSLFLNKEMRVGQTIHIVSILLGILPALSYHYYLLAIVAKGQLTSAAGTIVWAPAGLPVKNYILSFGPLLILALFAMIQKEMWKNPKRRLLILWAFVPFFLYYAPDIKLPTGGIRVFQTYQHIPLAILATFSIYRFQETKKSILFNIAVLVLSFVFIAFAFPSYRYNLQFFSSSQNPYFDTYYLLKKAQETFYFLNASTKKDSVVVAGEKIGMMIPAFTHNKVIIGHNGNNINYNKKRGDVQKFLGGFIPVKDTPEFLKTYKVNYILHGLDALEYSAVPISKNNLPYVKPVYKEKNITLLQVDTTKLPQ